MRSVLQNLIQNGFLDKDRTLFESAKEETGLDISDLRLFFHTSNVDEGKNKQFVTLIFSARYPGQTVILNPEEHDEYAWINPLEIGSYKTVGYLKDCLNSYSKQD